MKRIMYEMTEKVGKQSFGGMWRPVKERRLGGNGSHLRKSESAEQMGSGSWQNFSLLCVYVYTYVCMYVRMHV